jgi:hypothetical protein
MSTTRKLAAALAIAALAAPAAQAQAQPPDMHASTAQAAAQIQKKQDLRGEAARDAALHPRDAGTVAPRPVPGPPTWPANPQAIAPAPAAETTDGSGIDWTPIAIGVGASLLGMAGLLALNGRRTRRLHRPGVTV